MRVLEVKGNTEAESEASGKWTGYIIASTTVPLDKAWQIGSDFSGLHKFVPIVEVCERLKGCNRTPGCLRFYTMNSATGLPGGKRKAWAKDRLLNIDEKTHSFTYAVEGSNMNLDNCEVSFMASDGKDGTTIINWAWAVDPVKKSTKEKTLSDMSEFGCTFIKGLEAAATTTDSIDFDFEGAPLDTLIGGDGDGGGLHSQPLEPPAPFLSLMKSRLDTLTESLAKISQNLEEGPFPANLYKNELQSLQSTLDEGRRSLLTYLHGYMSNKAIGQGKSIGNSNQSSERYERSCISDASTSKTDSELCWGKPEDALTPQSSNKSARSHDDYCMSSSETRSPTAEASIREPDSEALPRKPVDAPSLNLKCLPDKEKSRTPDGECQAGLPKSPKVPSAEELRLIMEAASRGALDAFQDFSNQFHSDLRDDISHHLESVEAQLEGVGLQMHQALKAVVKVETLKNRPKAEIQGEKSEIGAPKEGQETALTPTLERYPDSKLAPSPPSLPSYEAETSPLWSQSPEDNQGQFGVWKLDRLRSQRSQGSPKGIHSVRFKSRLLFQDLLQDDMCRESDSESSEKAKVSPRTFQFTDSFQKLRVTDGDGCSSQIYTFGGQRSPSPHSPKVINVPSEFHSQSEGSESRQFRKCPPRQNDNTHFKGGFQIRDHQHVNEMETGGHDRFLKMEHGTSEIGQRTLEPCGYKGSRIGLMLDDSSDDNSQKTPYHGSIEDLQQLQVSPRDRQHRGPNMCQPSQNLDSDAGRPTESPGGDFHGSNESTRPSRLPPDIWPNFPEGTAGFGRNVLNSVEVQDNSRGACTGHDLEIFEFRSEQIHSSPRSQNLRDILVEQKSLPTSPSPCQSSKTYRKILKVKSHSPPPYSPSRAESVPQSAGGGRHVTSPSRTLDEMSSKLGSEGANSSPVFGSPSYSLDQSSGSPLSAGYSLGQISNRHVMLDLKHEIAPGVFHCRRGNQTLVVINIPEDLEARNESRRQLHSLLRKDEIYKEFKLLGIQKPPTEEQILEDFAAARYQKQQGAISETKNPSNDFPVYQPYYADGKVWAPDVGPCPTVDKSRFEKVGAGSVDTNFLTRVPAGHLSETTSPSGRSAGNASETEVRSCTKVASQGRFPTARNIERRSQSEQQLSVINSCQGDEIPAISEGSRVETTARELAAPTSWGGGLKDYKGSRPSRTKTFEKSISRHASSMQKRGVLYKELGRRTSHAQPSSNSKHKAKTKTGASSLTKRPSCCVVTSPADNTSREHTSTDFGDSFPQKERLDEIVSGFFVSRAIVKKVQANLLEINSPSVATCLNESRQPDEVSLRSSLDNSIDNILSNLSQNSEEIQWLDITFKRPTTREHSLDEVVHNMPSDSGSSDFNPYRLSGKLGSSTGSTGSNTGSGHSLRDQLLFYNSCQLTPTEETSPPDSLSHSKKGVLQVTKNEQPDIIYSSLMYPDDFVEVERISNPMSPGSCQDCPFGQLKEEVDEIIQSSESGSPIFPSGPPQRLNVRVSWADESSVSPQCTCKSEQLVSTPPPRTTGTLSAILDGMSQELKDIKAQQSNLNVRLEEAGPQKTTAQASKGHQSDPNFILEGPGTRRAISAQGFQSGDSQQTRPLNLERHEKQLDKMRGISLNDAKFRRSLDREKEQRQLDEKLQNGLKSAKPLQGILDVKLRKTYRDVATQTDFQEQSEVTQSWSSRTSQTSGMSVVEGSRTSQSTQGSRTNVVDVMDDQRSYSQMLNDMVGKRADRESMNSFQTRKKRAATDLAFGTRQSAQMLNSMINVREFTDANRSYSMWLDGAAQTLTGNGWTSSETQTPQIVTLSENGELVEPRSHESPETQALGNAPESFESGEPWEAQGPREPRFREDSAANFLGSVKMQILQEFSDSVKSGANAQDQSRGPKELGFSEDSATNFLGALSQQIVQQFTEHMSRQSQGPGQSEGPSEPRFRQQSALNFLADLSEQLLPEFQGRRTSQTTSGRSDAGEPRFRESSAINFLSALRGQVMQRSRQNSISEHASFHSQNDDLSESKIVPPRYSELMEESEDQAYRTEGLAYQLDPEKEGNVDFQTVIEIEPYLDDGGSYQLDPLNQAYPAGEVNYQSDQDNQAFPGEGSSSQPDAEGQEYREEGLTYQPESGVQGYGDEASNYQLDAKGQAFPGEGFGSQPSGEGQGYQEGRLSSEPTSEDQGYGDEAFDYQPVVEGQAFLGSSLGSQPDAMTNQESKNQSFVKSGSRRYSQSQLVAAGSQNSQRSSQNAVPNTDTESQNQIFVRSGSRQYSQSRNSQSQFVDGGLQNSQRSSQNAVLDAYPESQNQRSVRSGSRQSSESRNSQSQLVDGGSRNSWRSSQKAIPYAGQDSLKSFLRSGSREYSQSQNSESQLVDGGSQNSQKSLQTAVADADQASQKQSFMRSRSRQYSQSQLVDGGSQSSRRSSHNEVLDANQDFQNQSFVRSGSRQYSQSRNSQCQLVDEESQDLRRSSQSAVPDIGQDSQNQSFVRSSSRQYSQSRNSQTQFVPIGSQNSRRSSQNAILNTIGQAFSGKSLGSEPNEDLDKLVEVSSDEPDSEGEEDGDEASNDHPDTEAQADMADGSDNQLDVEGLEYLVEDSSDQPDAEGQEYLVEGGGQPDAEGQEYPIEGLNDQIDPKGEGYTDEGLSSQPDPEGQDLSDEGLNYQSKDQPSKIESGNFLVDGEMDTMTNGEYQNQSFVRSGRRQYSESRNSQSQPIVMGSRNSLGSSQNVVLDEMLQDMQTTISRSRQNSLSNSGS